MRLARIALGDAGSTDAPRTAVVEGEQLLVLPAGAPTIDDLVRLGLAAALAAVEELLPTAETVALADAVLLAPLARFNRDILCTGWNYTDHFYESLGKRAGQGPDEMPEHPTFFTKGPGVVIGPTDPIAFDAALSAKWDYEAEVALVIGTGGRSLRAETAARHVFGYFVANDVSQRDLQRQHGGQWLKGKSVDGTMPIGPWITTADEVDLDALHLSLTVNGELRQNSSATAMAFPVPVLLEELSRGMTLEAGDVLLTGTPSGIGSAREPAVFLADGDEIVTRVDGLGELRNRVTATDLTSPA
ncbi:fumarylacetoacetate hydrolase family protein [Herbiconiux sp. CPCC 203407]|uniref:Fumarylacetoacetate hydrolase family protein n=1 Tax=Herbiconiux oxytropis TaxID=2970915 RepID=A0AA41XEC0_9MICO|nr:fumarylacetoacetate hydrolase family protein [Herbiconiux oxytropis]MCS5721746.1 fumarylacetoacetate hydrolase family protein [Herbiconiux oxytropis]MCS5726627.1 fumarylacetoacetate hydrolase family protein [Herbiconiux oxytropis]